jgi:hypothetical protein
METDENGYERTETVRKWVNLTDEQIHSVIRPFYHNQEIASRGIQINMDEYRAIEKALKEKNT